MPHDSKGIPTQEDPYGESEHWCTSCQAVYSQIVDEVRGRLKGILARSVKRRFEKWKRKWIVLSDPAEELYS